MLIQVCNISIHLVNIHTDSNLYNYFVSFSEYIILTSQTCSGGAQGTFFAFNPTQCHPLIRNSNVYKLTRSRSVCWRGNISFPSLHLKLLLKNMTFDLIIFFQENVYMKFSVKALYMREYQLMIWI